MRSALACPVPPIGPIDAGKEIEILAHAEIAIELEFLRHIAEAVAHCGTLTAQVDAGDPALAGARLQEASQHLES